MGRVMPLGWHRPRTSGRNERFNAVVFATPLRRRCTRRGRPSGPSLPWQAGFLPLLGLPAEHLGADPAGVVLPDPEIIRFRRPRLPSVGEVVHSRKRQRFHPPTLAYVEIGVLVPADDVKEEVPNTTDRPGR